MTKAEALAWIKRTRVVPVVRAPSAEVALQAVEALFEGGIDVLEITMTVPGALEVMRQVALTHGSKALVGAGTVTSAEMARECLDAGAKFIVSPAFDLETVRLCGELGVTVCPGALTPTEIVTAYAAGADMVKVFPCDAMGGASYIKSLKAPLPHIPLMPTGGVALENIGTFLKAGAEAVGVGGNLVDVGLVQSGRHAELVSRARAFREAAG